MEEMRVAVLCLMLIIKTIISFDAGNPAFASREVILMNE